MRFFSSIVKRLMLIFAFSLNAFAGETPDHVGAVNGVDVQQYLGTWYEIARLDHGFERNLEQVTDTYSLLKNGQLHLVKTGHDAQLNSVKRMEGDLYFIAPAHSDGTYNGMLKLRLGGAFYGPYHIIALDKTLYNYAMVTGGKDYLWILSRTPQLTYPIKQELMSQAKALGFATENLIFVKQANQVEYESGRHVIPQHN